MSIIITIDDLNAYVPSKSLSAGLAQTVVDAVNEYITRQTNRCWGDTVTVTERYDIKRVIYLRHMDVVEVTSITQGMPNQAQTTLTTSSYWLDPAIGRIEFPGYFYSRGFLDSRYARSGYGITYTYGNPVVPDDLKLAALGVAMSFYNWSTTENKDIKSVSTGSYRVEYATGRDQGNSTSPTVGSENYRIISSYAAKRAW